MKLKNSLAIYVYYDKYEELTEEALYYLLELNKNFENVILVVNGKLKDLHDKIKNNLSTNHIQLIERKNIGYDFGAWKEVIQNLGKEKMKSLDFLCLCNSSCFGPIYPFSDTLKKIINSNQDVLGLTEHPQKDGRNRHIQSYFLLFKNRVLHTDFFFDYWNNLLVPSDWHDVVSICEVGLTEKFEEKGFSCGSVYNFPDLTEKEANVTFIYAAELIERGFPLLKKKAFSLPYDYYLNLGNASEAKNALSALKGGNSELHKMVIDYLTTRIPPSSQRYSLHSTALLCPHNSKKDHLPNNAVVGCIFFVYYSELIPLCLKFINLIPDDVKICIISSNIDILENYKSCLAQKRNLEFRLKDNRGRNEAAYFVDCRDLLLKWDYCCLLHDKKTSHAPHPHMGEAWFQHCLLNLIPSKAFIYNVVEEFETNEHLGLLLPPPPLFSNWTELILSDPWASNQEIAQQILRKFSNTLDLDVDPMAPYGGMGWFRTKAIKKLLDLNLTLEDFPEEPLPINGTFLHGLERIYPQIIQAHGFSSSWVISTEYGPTYIDNLYYQLKKKITTKEVKVVRVEMDYSLPKIISHYLKKYPRFHGIAKYLFNLIRNNDRN